MSNPVVSPVSRAFSEELYNRLTTVFERSIGINLDIRQIDRLHDECRKLADLFSREINKVAQRKALEVCKLLNEATVEGFRALGKDLADLRELTAPDSVDPTPKV